MMRMSQSPGRAQDVLPFDLTDRGLLLADGVFDTARVVNGRIILRAAHEQRLLADAAALGIVVQRDAVRALADEAVPAGGNGALRLTLTRGPGARGLAGDGADVPTLIARFTAMDAPFPMPAVRLGTSDIRRNPTSPSVQHKTLSYTDNVIALRRAAAAGYDDALLLSVSGNVACASAANLFACFGDRLVTPPRRDGAMPGILRGWLLSEAGKAGFVVSEESISPERLVEADGVFLTNSLRVFQPVSAIDGRTLNSQLPASLLELGRELLTGASDD
ncbi:aminotransferase class IV [Hyphomonas sp. WL0036]|uniref:aminotransferase class IV n=1 Tax=Hyphomonas sediminis TaxID=2866160 RepID=UPI001C7ED587|nr:aminotransferase class IV [Hyphomonas sediminis]MBY9068031.1 aminotransferase class IV [Hyphomonas sediminis]